MTSCKNYWELGKSQRVLYGYALMSTSHQSSLPATNRAERYSGTNSLSKFSWFVTNTRISCRAFVEQITWKNHRFLSKTNGISLISRSELVQCSRHAYCSDKREHDKSAIYKKIHHLESSSPWPLSHENKPHVAPLGMNSELAHIEYRGSTHIDYLWKSRLCDSKIPCRWPRPVSTLTLSELRVRDELNGTSMVPTRSESWHGITVSISRAWWRSRGIRAAFCRQSRPKRFWFFLCSRVCPHGQHLTDFSELSTHRYHPSKPFQPIGPSQASLAVAKGPPKKSSSFFWRMSENT